VNAIAPGAPPRALIVAVDGALADTATARANAVLTAALAAAGDRAMPPVRAELVTGALRGRPMHEAVELLWPAVVEHDPTRLTLVALEAERLLTESLRVGQGVRIDRALQQRVLDALAGGTRVVLRSDSARSGVEALLAHSALAGQPFTLLCADDRTATQHSGPVAERTWQTIDRRLQGLDIPAAARLAIEATHEVAAIARAFAAHVEVWTASQ